MAALPFGKTADVQATATVDWSPLGEIYVKKTIHYNLKWEKNLEEYIVAIAPYGGPVESMGEVPLCVVRKQHNRLSAGSVLFGSWLCKGS
jgi:hypothetical protein